MKKNIILAIFLTLFPVFNTIFSLGISAENSISSFFSPDFIKKINQNVAQLQVYSSNFNWKEPYKSLEEECFRGSAFFVPSSLLPDEGYLLTNYHVVKDAKCIEAYFPSYEKEPFECEVIGACPTLDCALIRLKKDDFLKLKACFGSLMSTLAFGDSDTLNRLDPLYAVGYPLGTENWKITSGVFSGIEQGGFDQVNLQTSAPINPGNSGGPLINSMGNIVGITTSIGLHRYGQADGIGYSIPINEIALILPRLLNEGLVHHLESGARYSKSTEALDDYYNNPRGGGIYVKEVYKKGLAEKVGLQKGDKIYALKTSSHVYTFDRFGQLYAWYPDKISSLTLLNRFMRQGSSVVLMLYRNSKSVELEVPVDINLVVPIRKIFPEFEKERTQYIAFGGMIIMEFALNHLDFFPNLSTLRKYLHTMNSLNPSLIISHLEGGSLIDRTQEVYAGEIVVCINDEPISTLDEARNALAKSKETGFIKIETQHGGCTIVKVEDVLKQESALMSKPGYVSAVSLFSSTSSA